MHDRRYVTIRYGACREEVLISGVGGGHFTVAIRTIGRRYVDDMIVCEALAVVLDVLHGSLVQ